MLIKLPEEFEKYNRPCSPENSKGEFFYSVYKILLEQRNIKLRTKQVTLETAIVNEYPWKIVCISHNALAKIVETRSAKGLQRAHPLKRIERAKFLYDRDAALEYGEFIEFYFKYDSVALVEKSENNLHGTQHWSKLHEVPDGRLTGGSFSVATSRADIEWAEQLLTNQGLSQA